MLPLYRPSDYVLVMTRLFRLNISDFVIVAAPGKDVSLQKVVNLNGDGVKLTTSTESQLSDGDMNWIPPKHIIGKVIFRIAKPRG